LTAAGSQMETNGKAGPFTETAAATQHTVPDQKPSAEEQRLQKFWSDYYTAVKKFYGELDRLDWVAYYKNHGYLINVPSGTAKGDGQKSQFAPVFVTPTMQWAIPAAIPNGPPSPFAPGEQDKAKKTTAADNTKPTKVNAQPLEFKAVSLGADAAAATKTLNQLTAEGWHYVGPVGNGIVIFDRPVPVPSKGQS
jgi:hypothetical protein